MKVFIVTRNIYDDNNKITLYEIYDENQILLAKTDKKKAKYHMKKVTKEKKLKKNFGKFYEESGIEKKEISYLIREKENS